MEASAGEVVEVHDDSEKDAGWLSVRTTTGLIGRMPTVWLIDEDVTPESHVAFHNVTREESVNILESGYSAGSFLVRPSEEYSNHYTLTVLTSENKPDVLMVRRLLISFDPIAREYSCANKFARSFEVYV